MERSAGILLHPTSLPSSFGVGDLGEDAYRWLEVMAQRGQRLWQMCPLGPTGYGNSPYQCRSSFAGNPILISPSLLCQWGLLNSNELSPNTALPVDRVDYDGATRLKERLFRSAFARFKPDTAFEEFCSEEADWLDDYALFEVIRVVEGGNAWNEWPVPLRDRTGDSLAVIGRSHSDEVAYQKFLQYVFYRQWRDLRTHATSLGVAIVGDIPYYCAFDSADAWANPEILELDRKRRARRVAGVPPDYFSATGQLWGNPVYDWKRIRKDGFAWWVTRIAKTLELSDFLRIDHFRGFESFWAVPAGEPTAVKGVWEPAPGAEFFAVLEKRLGHIPLIAEDLGLITKEVVELRKQIGIPGMKVLQFAFDGSSKNPYLLHNIDTDCVVYTGTHDNNTTVGWFAEISDADRWRICEYLGADANTFLDRLLRLAYSCPAAMCIIPLQDVLGLGPEHRMNVPGQAGGNWGWRFPWDMLDDQCLSRCAEYTRIYGRLPTPEAG